MLYISFIEIHNCIFLLAAIAFIREPTCPETHETQDPMSSIKTVANI